MFHRNYFILVLIFGVGMGARVLGDRVDTIRALYGAPENGGYAAVAHGLGQPALRDLVIGGGPQVVLSFPGDAASVILELAGMGTLSGLEQEQLTRQFRRLALLEKSRWLSLLVHNRPAAKTQPFFDTLSEGELNELPVDLLRALFLDYTLAKAGGDRIVTLNKWFQKLPYDTRTAVELSLIEMDLKAGLSFVDCRLAGNRVGITDIHSPPTICALAGAAIGNLVWWGLSSALGIDGGMYAAGVVVVSGVGGIGLGLYGKSETEFKNDRLILAQITYALEAASRLGKLSRGMEALLEELPLRLEELRKLELFYDDHHQAYFGTIALSLNHIFQNHYPSSGPEDRFVESRRLAQAWKIWAVSSAMTVTDASLLPINLCHRLLTPIPAPVTLVNPGKKELIPEL